MSQVRSIRSSFRGRADHPPSGVVLLRALQATNYSIGLALILVRGSRELKMQIRVSDARDKFADPLTFTLHVGLGKTV